MSKEMYRLLRRVNEAMIELDCAQKTTESAVKKLKELHGEIGKIELPVLNVDENSEIGE